MQPVQSVNNSRIPDSNQMKKETAKHEVFSTVMQMKKIQTSANR